jgi:macrolide transport system ATP-binding/permease protein
MALVDSLQQRGNTVLLVTHERSLADRAARVLELHDGRIVSDTRNRAFAPTAL